MKLEGCLAHTDLPQARTRTCCLSSTKIAIFFVGADPPATPRPRIGVHIGSDHASYVHIAHCRLHIGDSMRGGAARPARPCRASSPARQSHACMHKVSLEPTLESRVGPRADKARPPALHAGRASRRSACALPVELMNECEKGARGAAGGDERASIRTKRLTLTSG